jgi:hypothetical protein
LHVGVQHLEYVLVGVSHVLQRIENSGSTQKKTKKHQEMREEQWIENESK